MNAQRESQMKMQARIGAEEQARGQQLRIQEEKKKKEANENEKLMSQLESLQEDQDLLQGLEEMEKEEKIEIKKRLTGTMEAI